MDGKMWLYPAKMLSNRTPGTGMNPRWGPANATAACSDWPMTRDVIFSRLLLEVAQHSWKPPVAFSESWLDQISSDLLEPSFNSEELLVGVGHALLLLYLQTRTWGSEIQSKETTPRIVTQADENHPKSNSIKFTEENNNQLGKQQRNIL